MTSDGETTPTEEPGSREQRAGGSHARREARRRIEARRGFTANVVAYVVINLALIGVWAVSGGGYFWPAWVLLGWGVGIVFHAWDTFFKRPVTEADIDEELRRQSG